MAQDKEAPLQEHLIELLERLRRMLIALIISSMMPFVTPDPNALSGGSAYRPIIFLIMNRIREDMTNVNNPVVRPIASFLGIDRMEVELIAYSWIDSIEVLLLVSLLTGAIISSPYIAKQIYGFIEPALLEREKRILIPFALGFIVLFACGVAYAYLVVLPLTVFFLSLIYMASGVRLMFSIQQFFSFIIVGILIVGLFFTFPLIVAILSYLDLITPSTIKRNWRYLFLAMLILTAVITPDPTPVSMLILSIPFLVLYWLSYLLAKRFHGSRSGAAPPEIPLTRSELLSGSE
ncbi:MAG: twin-arginine translocase subunit TatC [Candidatus Korarchaeum sp.]